MNEGSFTGVKKSVRSRARRDEAGGGVAVVGEALREVIAPQVEMLRETVVEEVPDHFDAVFGGSLEEGLDGREIVASVPEIDERPADHLARRAEPQFGELAVIVVDGAFMAGRDNVVEPLAMAVEPGRTFETGKEEAAKHH